MRIPAIWLDSGLLNVNPVRLWNQSERSGCDDTPFFNLLVFERLISDPLPLLCLSLILLPRASPTATLAQVLVTCGILISVTFCFCTHQRPLLVYQIAGKVKQPVHWFIFSHDNQRAHFYFYFLFCVWMSSFSLPNQSFLMGKTH